MSETELENMNIDSIDHFVITASDVEVICAFYKRVLGMRVREFSKGRKALYLATKRSIFIRTWG